MLTVKRMARIEEPGRYADGLGLYLQVGPNGAKSWLFRYERVGRERWMGLGPTHTISLEDARERARLARRHLIDGIDPLDARQKERASAALEAAKNVTFATVVADYVKAHEAKWTNAKWHRQFSQSLGDFVLPVFGQMPVSAVNETLVLKALKPIWESKSVTAVRVRRRVEAVLDYATAAKLRTGDNPARWDGNLEYLLPAPKAIAKVKNHDALPYAELGAFMVELRDDPSIIARALEFTILTCARTGEVGAATWAEIEDRTWTLSAERMKMGKPHRVPLSPRALEILAGLKNEPGFGFIFGGAKPLHDRAMYRLLRRLRPGISVHGFRSDVQHLGE